MMCAFLNIYFRHNLIWLLTITCLIASVSRCIRFAINAHARHTYKIILKYVIFFKNHIIFISMYHNFHFQWKMIRDIRQIFIILYWQNYIDFYLNLFFQLSLPIALKNIINVDMIWTYLLFCSTNLQLGWMGYNFLKRRSLYPYKNILHKIIINCTTYTMRFTNQ